MVPRQRFNELKPNSGWNRRNSLDFTEKKILREMARDARGNCGRKPAVCEKRLWQRRIPFVVEQMREKFANIARRIEMPRYTFRTPADRECESVEIRHDANTDSSVTSSPIKADDAP
jgi:hypothetical protein